MDSSNQSEYTLQNMYFVGKYKHNMDICKLSHEDCQKCTEYFLVTHLVFQLTVYIISPEVNECLVLIG